MVKTVVNKDLSEYGDEFQRKLIKAFVERKDFFSTISYIVNQNLFSDVYCKTIVGIMKDYFSKYGSVPSFKLLSVLIDSSNMDEINKQECKAIVDACQNMTTEGEDVIVERAKKFFLFKNLQVVAIDLNKELSTGNVSVVPKCMDMMQKAMDAGNDVREFEHPLENMEELLAPDFRKPIPTGIERLDRYLEGGIGEGELGLIIGPSGFGKVQPNDAIVMTPYGPMTMGEISVGDYVIGSNGKPAKVLNVFPHKDWDFYQVTFSDGSSTRCGKEHLWLINTVYGRESKQPFQVMSLEDIMVDMAMGKKYFIPVCQPVEYEEREVPIPPYEMGAMIGLYLSEYSLEDISNFQLDDYIYNSIENRLKFLSGLIDTSDFLYNVNGTATIRKDRLHPSVIKLFKELVQSLGGIGELKEYGDLELILPKIGDETYFKDTAFPLQDMSTYNRYITNVTYVGKLDGKCIKVDSPNETYLTDDYIVTHNTSMLVSLACSAALKGYKVMHIYFEDKKKNVERKMIGYFTDIEVKDIAKNIEDVRRILTERKEDIEFFKSNYVSHKMKSGQYSLDELESDLRRVINKGFRPNLLLIDYFECLKLLPPIFAGEKQYEIETRMTRRLESISEEYNMATWFASQSNREGMRASKDRQIGAENIGGGFGKFQVAHINLGIARTDTDRENNVAAINIMKNRSGMAGIILPGVYFNNGTCHIGDRNEEDIEFNDFNQMNDYNVMNMSKQIQQTALKINMMQRDKR